MASGKQALVGCLALPAEAASPSEARSNGGPHESQEACKTREVLGPAD